MTILNVDLHTHSHYSDGILSPSELVRRAKGKGVQILALTDHNSTDGVTEAVLEGAKAGIEVIPAIEMKFSGGEMLGYFIDINDKGLREALASSKESSCRRIGSACSRLSERGFDISFDSLMGMFPHTGSPNWTHLLYYLYNTKQGSSLREISDRIYRMNVLGSAEYPNASRAISLIRAAGGVPVLAHPWASRESTALLGRERIDGLIREGLAGIEFDQGDRRKRTYEIVNRILQVSKTKGIALTSGSDFHGDFMMDPRESVLNHELGSHNCSKGIVELLRKSANSIPQKKIS